MAGLMRPTLQRLSRVFHISPERIGKIDPERDHRNRIAEYTPCERFPNRQGLALHEWGEGPFCRFKIQGRSRRESGVYLITDDQEIVFIGFSADLGRRFNQNYGTISPRKCYEISEIENCMINNLILEASLSGREVLVYLIRDGDQALCDELKDIFVPDWNEELLRYNS